MFPRPPFARWTSYCVGMWVPILYLSSMQHLRSFCESCGKAHLSLVCWANEILVNHTGTSHENVISIRNDMYSQHMSYELHPEVRCPIGGHFNDVLFPFWEKTQSDHMFQCSTGMASPVLVCVPFCKGQYLAASSLSASRQITWAWVP